jgi:hypothetical protein
MEEGFSSGEEEALNLQLTSPAAFASYSLVKEPKINLYGRKKASGYRKRQHNASNGESNLASGNEIGESETSMPSLGSLYKISKR